jgi:hypothetical protein
MILLNLKQRASHRRFCALFAYNRCHFVARMRVKNPFQKQANISHFSSLVVDDEYLMNAIPNDFDGDLRVFVQSTGVRKAQSALLSDGI